MAFLSTKAEQGTEEMVCDLLRHHDVAHLLLGRHFVLRTDHRNLIDLNLEGSAQVLRWKLAIELYDFDISHNTNHPRSSLGQ